MTDSDTDDVDEIIEQSKNQSRTNTEAATTESTEETQPLDEAVADALADIEDGDLHKNITLRDGNLAALFAALDETGRLEDIQRDAEDATGREEEDVTTAAAARALIRVGLEEVAEDAVADAKNGREMYILDNESVF